MHTVLQWLKHNNLALLLSFFVFWVPLILFFQLADAVIEREAIPLDSTLLTWLHNHANPLFDMVFYAATTLGGILSMALLSAILLVYFLVKNQRARALLLIGSVGGAMLANLGLKALFQRTRPDVFETFIAETSYSFPSGHAMASSAFALCLILLFWHTKWRWLITTMGVLFILLVGISRPYFGVHYPSDIVAGWCASTGWVLLVFFVVRKFGLKIRPMPKKE